MNQLIFHLDDSRNLRGGERQVLYLAAGLAHLDCGSVVVCRRGAPLEREARRLGLETIPFRFGFEWDVVAAARLARRIRTTKARLGFAGTPVLHAHTAHAAAAAHLTARFVRATRIAHRRVDFRLKPGLSARLKYGRADAVIALSAAIGRILAEAGVDERRIRVIPSAVDLSAFGAPDPAFKARLRSELGLPPEAVVFLSLMALVPHKDPLNLIAAAQKALLVDRRCRFLLAGEGPLKGVAEALVERSGLAGAFHLLGQREDNLALLGAADAFVLPSREEGLGSALIEAMASGLPLIGTDAGGIPELIEDGGNGFLVPKENAAALADAVLRLAADPALRARFGERSRELSRRYSADRMAAETLDVYKTAAASR